jgi:hypothetical protein
MITKPVGIITSLGRTGTLFFANLLEEVVPDSSSFHETGYLNFGQYQDWREKTRQIIHQIETIGFKNIILKKAAFQWSLLRLSNRNIIDQVNKEEAVQIFINRRKDFIEGTSRRVYFEASSEYFGLLDLFSDVFRTYRGVYIVRDGRDWVRSQMNFGKGGYDNHWLRQAISPPLGRGTIKHFPEIKEDWPSYTPFQKLCWVWAEFNRRAIDVVNEDPNLKLYRFEDLFNSEQHAERMVHMVSFLLPISLPIDKEKISFKIRNKVHQSSGEFPGWSDWPGSMRDDFMDLAGGLMHQLKYNI